MVKVIEVVKKNVFLSLGVNLLSLRFFSAVAREKEFL